jgi:hypothetical protein
MKQRCLLIGKGKWGGVFEKELKKYFYIDKVFNSKNAKEIKKTNLKDIKWVFILSPNNTHFKYTSYFLKKSVNVFCEKPLTLNYKSSLKLLEIAKSKKKILYISNIDEFKDQIKLKNINYFYRSKYFKHNNDYDFIERLVYHQLYLIFSFFDKIKINQIQFSKNTKYFKIFKIKINQKYNFVLKYNLNKKKKYTLNRNNLFNYKKNPLSKMIIYISKLKFNSFKFQRNIFISEIVLNFIKSSLDNKIKKNYTSLNKKLSELSI